MINISGFRKHPIYSYDRCCLCGKEIRETQPSVNGDSFCSNCLKDSPQPFKNLFDTDIKDATIKQNNKLIFL